MTADRAGIQTDEAAATRKLTGAHTRLCCMCVSVLIIHRYRADPSNIVWGVGFTGVKDSLMLVPWYACFL